MTYRFPPATPGAAIPPQPGAARPGANIHPDFRDWYPEFVARRRAEELARDQFVPEEAPLPNDLPHFADVRSGKLVDLTTPHERAGRLMARVMTWAAIALGVVFVVAQVVGAA